MRLFFYQNEIFRRRVAEFLAFAAGMAFFSLIYATFPSWEKVFQLAQTRYGQAGLRELTSWRDMVLQAQNLPEREKITRVNDFFNSRIQFRDDVDIWKMSDYWATPLETMGRGEGDCEDFAIAKYVTLKDLGVPISKLRMTYVRAVIGGSSSSVSQAHMVLGYYASPLDEPLILDNLINDIRPASRRPDLYPVFSFNSEGLWIGGGASEKASGSSTARLSRWRDLLARMQQEGFE